VDRALYCTDRLVFVALSNQLTGDWKIFNNASQSDPDTGWSADHYQTAFHPLSTHYRGHYHATWQHRFFGL